MKLHKVAITRTCLRLLILALFFAIAGINHYSTVKAQQGGQEEIARSRMLTFVDKFYGSSPHRPIYEHVAGGGLWSFQIKGFRVSDPLAVLSDTAASKALHGLMFLSLILPMVGTLLLGRVFCSWICPANLLLEITGKLRGLLRFAEIPPAEVKFSRANKYVLLAVGLLIAAIVGLPIFALIYPPAALSRLLHGWIFGTPVTGILVT